MKVMFIVYHDVNTEARTQEILQCAQMLGETYFVSYSKPAHETNCTPLVTGGGVRNYRTFLWDSLRYIKLIKPDIIILHDNYTAVILGWLLRKKRRPYIIYDSSELYLARIGRGVKSRLVGSMQYFERKYLKHADIVIAANLERAQIMKKEFELSKLPIVFDNVHRIDDTYDVVECKGKYGAFVNANRFKILYAGGISEDRKTFDLAKDVGKLGPEYQLVVVGSSRESEKKRFYRFLGDHKISNVAYLGFISRSELRYLLQMVHISVSAFSEDTVNNKYCASGKVYESLFEGKPILVTENPPLKRLCDDFGVGVSTDDFYSGILELRRNYAKYQSRVEQYVNTVDYPNRVLRLAEEISGIQTFNDYIKQGFTSDACSSLHKTC